MLLPSKMLWRRLYYVALLLSLTRVQTAALTPGCIGSTNELIIEESKVTDLSVTREYVLCEEAVFNVGFLDYYFGQQGGGSDMIQLRPNLHLKCGASGSRSNNCLVTSGDVQMEGTTFYGAPGDILDNVVITGVTFANARKHTVWINKPGNILFQDCEFRVSGRFAKAPIAYSSARSNKLEDIIYSPNKLFCFYGRKTLRHCHRSFSTSLMHPPPMS